MILVEIVTKILSFPRHEKAANGLFTIKMSFHCHYGMLYAVLMFLCSPACNGVLWRWLHHWSGEEYKGEYSKRRLDCLYLSWNLEGKNEVLFSLCSATVMSWNINQLIEPCASADRESFLSRLVTSQDFQSAYARVLIAWTYILRYKNIPRCQAHYP